MDATGAKAELVKELRRLGTRVAEASAYLGISAMVHTSLLEDQFVLDTNDGQLWGGSEEAVWVGIAHYLAFDLGIVADLGTLWEASAVAMRRSGLHRQIA